MERRSPVSRDGARTTSSSENRRGCGQGGRADVGEGGRAFGFTRGHYADFSPERVIYAPISESAIMDAAGGAALTGPRSVAELMFVDFLGVRLDQNAAKFRYMFGGNAHTPLVRTMIGASTTPPILVALPAFAPSQPTGDL